MSEPPVIVKVGGSLYDLPDLGARLACFLAPLPAALLVPGGGALVDAVRHLDATHGLGEETCHWLALQALSINARFLSSILPGTPVVDEVVVGGRAILDPYPFFRADELCEGRLPHDWRVTSDSLALRVAARAGAKHLVLLKSRDRDENASWVDGADLVDGWFPIALRKQCHPPAVRVVNLRAQ